MKNVIAKLAILSIVLAASGTAHAATRYVDATFDVQEVKNVFYGGSKLNGKIKEQQLDMYFPKIDAMKDRPAIVMIHGGSFRAGDKKDMRQAALMMAARGYVVASINYRLSLLTVPKPAPADQLAAANDAKEDAFGAIRWLRVHAAEYGINKNRIAALGYSAGAVTALAVDFEQNIQGNENSGGLGNDGKPLQNTAISGAVSLSGGYPLNISRGDKPVLLIHGALDTTVPVMASQMTANMAKAVSVDAKLIIKPAARHTYDLNDITAYAVPWMKKILVDGPPAK